MYLAPHVTVLRELNERMLARVRFPVLNFLAAMDNGNGHWREGEYVDAGHPNTAGHRRMFDAIDLRIFVVV
jgi:hypothetical protein